jgi:uncharacterized protein YbjT (DUF2867 family)
MRRRVVVFGGTGFLGHRVVRHLVSRGFAVRVASRHPEHGKTAFPDAPSQLELTRADLGDEASVRDAVGGTFDVVNDVSLYVERDNQTFQCVDVEAAERLAKHLRLAGVARGRVN